MQSTTKTKGRNTEGEEPQDFFLVLRLRNRLSTLKVSKSFAREAASLAGFPP